MIPFKTNLIADRTSLLPIKLGEKNAMISVVSTDNCLQVRELLQTGDRGEICASFTNYLISASSTISF